MLTACSQTVRNSVYLSSHNASVSAGVSVPFQIILMYLSVVSDAWWDLWYGDRNDNQRIIIPIIAHIASEMEADHLRWAMHCGNCDKTSTDVTCRWPVWEVSLWSQAVTESYVRLPRHLSRTSTGCQHISITPTQYRYLNCQGGGKVGGWTFNCFLNPLTYCQIMYLGVIYILYIF